MNEDRIHRAISDDGTEIAGRVVGQGSPLVLVHGVLEDGDLCWTEMLPLLRERFTCYLMSTRGRGLSGTHPDVSPKRIVEDVTAFVESIGEPVGLVGESGGGMYALGTAARSPSVAAVAAYEPVVFEVFGEEDAAALQETLGRASAAVGEDRLADAARIFAEPLVNDEEMAAVSETGYFDECGRYARLLLDEVTAGTRSHDYSATDPKVLEQISVPVLLMHGSESALHPWFSEGVRHIAQHVPNSQVRELPGIGHWAPVVQPEPIADEIRRFFSAKQVPA